MDGELHTFSVGPALKEHELVPKITYWENDDITSISWGLVTGKGFLSIGQIIGKDKSGAVVTYLEGIYN